MPNSHKLSVLTQLRKAESVTLFEMGEYFGFTGPRNYDTVGRWERGQSIPRSRRRPTFITYLLYKLRLHNDPAQFRTVWRVLEEEWHWQPVDETEWQMHFANLTEPVIDPALLPPPSVHPVALAALAAANSHLAQLPIGTVPPPAPLPSGSRMPFSRNPLFVGRQAELTSLATLLRRGTTAINEGTLTATTGMGGMGKTQLAIEFVHRYGQFFDGGVFWLNFAVANAVAAEVATSGGIGYLDLRPHFELLPLEQRVRLVRAAWESPLPRLLIFDNCEDEALLDQWRPHAGGCHILITSRRALWDAGLGVQVLPLATLSRAESVNLLCRHRPDLASVDADLDAIADTLGDLPLALHLAGKFLHRYQHTVTPGTYLEQLRRSSVLDHPSMQGDGFSPTAHQQHVARAFALSYRQLDPSNSMDQVALALLRRAAHFAPGEPIARDVLLRTLQPLDQDQADPQASEDALLRLRELGLLETADGEGMHIRMHRLVVAFVQATVEDSEAQATVEHVLYATTKHLNNTIQPLALLPLQTHLRFVTDIALKRGDEIAANLCFELGQHLEHIEDYQGAHYYTEQALRIRTHVFGTNAAVVAETLNNLAWLNGDLGNYSAQQHYNEQALAIYLTLFGEEHADTATTINLLGNGRTLHDDFVGARRYYERALDIRQRVLGQHTHVASVLNNLGWLHYTFGYYQEAWHYHQRALMLRREINAPPAELVYTLNNLGYLLRAMARYEEAQMYIEQAVAIREQVWGVDNSYTAFSVNHFARLAHAQGDFQKARPLLERVLRIREEALGLQHPDTANSLGNLGMLVFDQGDYQGARPYLLQALKIHEAMLAPTHRYVARSLNHVGILLHALGDLQAAQQYFERSLYIRLEVLGDHHPITANTMGNLAMVLIAQGTLERAQTYLEQALAAHQQALDPDHPYVARSLMRMGLLRKAQGNDLSAQAYLGQALALYTQKLGVDHPYTIACFSYL